MRLELIRRRGAGLVWLLAGLICLSLVVLPAAARNKAKEPEQFANLTFVVLRDSDGKAVKNASVIVHFLRPDGAEGEGFQLKTDSEGRAAINDIPYGRIRLQAIAPRLRTYGEDVNVNAAEQQFVIRLQPPADQVSVYK